MLQLTSQESTDKVAAAKEALATPVLIRSKGLTLRSRPT
jgi:hypothetical protein